jgi:uncharacterized damage-inducible protein DinB
VTDRIRFVKLWAAETATTRRVFARIPEGSDYKPDPKSRTAQTIAWQMVNEERMIIAAVESGRAAWSPGPMPSSMAELNAIYAAESEETVRRWGALPQERWDGELDLFGKSRASADLAWSFLLDLVHHRGQITTYLRAMGSTVPSIYGPSGDEP